VGEGQTVLVDTQEPDGDAVKRLLITFSGSKYHETTMRTVMDGPALGADEVRVYDDVWMMAHPHWQLNSWLWKHPGQLMPDGSRNRRGLNWYGFKPVVMIDAMDRFMSDGDVALWIDGDSYPVSSMAPIFDTAARDDVMFFSSTGHLQKTWCTRDCFEVMGQAWGKGIAAYGRDFMTTTKAGCARFFAMKKGPWHVRQFLYEWLTYTVNPMATTFDPSALGPELVGFEEHRTEQAIMTNLCHRYGHKLYRECDESGEGWPEDRDVMPIPIFQQVRQGSCQNGVGSAFRNV
jgi:hypothetical protein